MSCWSSQSLRLPSLYLPRIQIDRKIGFHQQRLWANRDGVKDVQNVKEYDVIVVGGGSAGLTAAKFVRTVDKSVIIVESAQLGGDCTWTGCVPSKTLIATANSIHSARQLYSMAERMDNDSAANQKKTGTPVGDGWFGNRKTEVISRLVQRRIQESIDKIYQRDDSPRALQQRGIDVLNGRAELVSPKSIQVFTASTDCHNSDSNKDTHVVHLRAREGIILCTGASPRVPSIPGLEKDSGVFWITYETIWSNLDRILQGPAPLPNRKRQRQQAPTRVTIIGGGPIACELGQALQRLGCCQVTIVVSQSLLPKEDVQVGQVLESVFRSEGIQVVKGRLVQVTLDPQGPEGSHLATIDSTTEPVAGHILLLATGRRPTVNGLGLANVGVDVDASPEATSGGGIRVDKKLQTSIDSIYAAGDCIGDRQFTHYAGFQGAIAARNILLPLSDEGVLGDTVPATTFTSPEVASIGLSEVKAGSKYGEERVASSYMSLDKVDRAVCQGESEHGFIKIVYHKHNLQILGATIVAPRAGEMVSEIAVAMAAKCRWTDLAKVMHSYPTFSIALQLMAADVYYDRSIRSLLPLYSFLKRIGL